MAFTPPVFAGFDVTFWELGTAVTHHANFDFDVTDQIQNPFIYTSLSAMGQNSVSADYDLSWLIESGHGVFHADVEQHIRDPEFRTQAVNVIHILPTEPLRVTLTGLLTYAHTPGDEASFNFNASVRDLATNQVVLSDQN